MTAPRHGTRASIASAAMITVSLVVTLGMSALLGTVVIGTNGQSGAASVSAVLFVAASILMALVGSVIERRRRGHRIGRLFLLTGPVYATLACIWLSPAGVASGSLGPTFTALEAAVGIPLSYGGMGLLIAGVPLLFPTGSLPGPRWRLYAAIPGIPFLLGLLLVLTKPGPVGDSDLRNPLGIDAWPTVLAPLADGIFVSLLALAAVGLAAQVARYRHGGQVERVQIRWFAASVAVVLAGFIATQVELAVRTSEGPVLTTIIAYVGILLMPITIGIAVLRYRLYEIDRIISRTIGWAIVTGLAVTVFAGVVVALSAALEGVTQGDTLAVAASTLVAASLFQPLRRRVQRWVDRRFDRVQYNAQRTTEAFAERLRGQVDLDAVARDLRSTARDAMTPRGAGLWLRGPGSRG